VNKNIELSTTILERMEPHFIDN